MLSILNSFCKCFYFWPNSDDNTQRLAVTKKPSSIRKTILQTMLYNGINTDFRESEEFLARMGELPENYQPNYRNG